MNIPGAVGQLRLRLARSRTGRIAGFVKPNAILVADFGFIRA
jgi:hypothetical protein